TDSTNAPVKWTVSRCSPVAPSYTFTSPAEPQRPPPATSDLPSGEYTSAGASPVYFPSSVVRSFPVGRSHNSISPTSAGGVVPPPETASVLPFGAKATPLTPVRFVFRTPSSFPSGLHRRTLRSQLAVASSFPSGDHASERMAWVCACSVALSVPVSISHR